MTLYASQLTGDPIGFFRIYARPLGKSWREITMLRGVPITVGSMSSSDPFTDSVANLSLPMVSVFDAPGQGDLDWLVEDTDINIVWQNTGSDIYNFQWEGFIAAFNLNLDGAEATFAVDLKGALYALDSYRAKPSFPSRPIPYEILIQRAFSQQMYPARLGPLLVTFPSGWTKRVPSFKDPSYLSFLKPWGVATGQKWTGLTSRSTGAWDPLLTGHVQSLLGVMFDSSNSQWTIRNNGHRRPELYLRRPPHPDSDQILEVTLGAPGVGLSASRDFTQMANVIFGEGTDVAGISYGNMQVAPDGVSTNYLPYAWAPQTYPRVSNPRFTKTEMPKETQIRFQDGLDERSAYQVARAQLQRFADPGLTGSLTLTADPMLADGTPFPRMLIKAGTTLRIRNLLGVTEGILVHATQVTADVGSLSVSITFDSKYRDQLTVEEVQARTRDALDPVRALQVSKFKTTTNDLVLPWSYAGGSGVVPSGGGRNATEFFIDKLPSTATFPYEAYTRKYPPSKYPNYYIKIGPANSSNATKNWAVRATDTGAGLAFPIRMAQAGTIKLSQFAAYDKNGNVLPVRFHVSVYTNNGVGPKDMPQFVGDPEATGIKYLRPFGDIPARKVNTNYGTGQRHPFFENAWETIQQDGTVPSDSTEVFLPAANAGLAVGWGNYWEPAGYSPGRASRGAPRTGMLSDNAPWTWSLDSTLDLQNPKNNKKIEDAGMLFINIYCDEQGTQPVYFMGRFFYQEPGAS